MDPCGVDPSGLTCLWGKLPSSIQHCYAAQVGIESYMSQIIAGKNEASSFFPISLSSLPLTLLSPPSFPPSPIPIPSPPPFLSLYIPLLPINYNPSLQTHFPLLSPFSHVFFSYHSLPFSSLPSSLSSRINEMEHRLDTPLRFLHPCYEALNWFAARDLLKELKGNLWPSSYFKIK